MNDLSLSPTLAARGCLRAVVVLAASIAVSVNAAAVDAVALAAKREASPPRKVLVGSIVCGYGVSQLPLDQRLDQMDAFAATIMAKATKEYPNRRMDLIVLPEYLISNRGETAAQQAVPLAQVEPRMAACARRCDAYVVIPMVLRETGTPVRYSNAAVLMNRVGHVEGIYRKVHPVAPQGSTVLEGGLTPGREFPVFACDFGRLGIQICFDMVYADGWQALAEHGAEIVALPTASPETAHPSMYALQHAYYIVSAAPRDHAAVYNPLGMIEAQATTEGVALVHEIDLSFALVHWDAVLEDGEALHRRYGAKVGYHYYRPEDGGVFWSNDPKLTIGQMLASIGLQNAEAELRRLERVQNEARGGPPSAATP